MGTEINPVGIFLPILAVVFLTLVAFVRMAVARARAAKDGGQDADYYRAFQGTPEPDYAIVAVRHYGNLFELPVLFYMGCLCAYVLGAVSGWALIWAWGYVVARYFQSAVHLTYNNPAHRGIAFVLGCFFVIALWVVVAIAVLGRV